MDRRPSDRFARASASARAIGLAGPLVIAAVLAGGCGADEAPDRLAAAATDLGGGAAASDSERGAGSGAMLDESARLACAEVAGALDDLDRDDVAGARAGVARAVELVVQSETEAIGQWSSTLASALHGDGVEAPGLVEFLTACDAAGHSPSR